MPLVNVKEMMEKARDGHYAVGAFNINKIGRASCRERV